MPQAEGEGRGASFVESFSQLIQNQQLKLSGILRGMFTHIHTLETSLSSKCGAGAGR